MKNVEKKIGLFDSGIGGFSVLSELFKVMPDSEYFYISDDANAPYGPKSDEFITKRAIEITNELIRKGCGLIVVACNTATASSIEELRKIFSEIIFVGVEPYLNAYYKMPEGEKKMVVLTTESTGKSERFKKLKERLDPNQKIDHYSLKNLARLIENYFYNQKNKEKFKDDLKEEISFLKDKGYTHAILGCTHYPLIANDIENILNVKTVYPCPYVANRVKELSADFKNVNADEKIFYFLSSRNNIWETKDRNFVELK